MPPRPDLAALLALALLAAGAAAAAAGPPAAQPAAGNRLVHSHDPYLLAHAHNPVDWYPWGPEALERAQREDRPIFLSIGYATCYWCHVAEREIYSDPAIARLMNRWFVNIKVDREQRPDLDRIYMLATQLMTGQGGWPNNVFLTPDLKPFYAGSYFPPRDEHGRAGFPRVLARLHRAWVEDRAGVEAAAERIYHALQQARHGAPAAELPPIAPWLAAAVAQAEATFDAVHGGFGPGSTRFPHAPRIGLLLAVPDPALAAKARPMALATLQALATGGVMDQLGGGFHRYGTTPEWSIPHFEKMLYDNAQLLVLYARAYRHSGQALFRQVALRTAHYLRRRLAAPGGGFYSAEDAEAGGIEGASYVWTRDQVRNLLGAAESERFFALYTLVPMPPGLPDRPHPTGGVLRLRPQAATRLAAGHRLAAAIDALAPLRERLLAARDRRPQPARDRKIVVADNALAVVGLAAAGRALGEQALTDTAVATAGWLWRQAVDARSGAVRHQVFEGRAVGAGFLDDYALLGRACTSAYRSSGDAVWLQRARLLVDAVLTRFGRPDGGLAASQHDDLLVAPPPEGDNVRPSGQSAAIALLLELASDTGQTAYAAAARRALQAIAGAVSAAPAAWGSLLTALTRTRLRTALEQAPPATAQVPDSADHVHVAGRLDGDTLTVTLEVDPGYHINAHPASAPDLVATELLAAGRPLPGVRYPAPSHFAPRFARSGIDVYQGRVALRAPLHGRPLGRLRLRVQACNREVCLAPAELPVPVR